MKPPLVIVGLAFLAVAEAWPATTVLNMAQTDGDLSNSRGGFVDRNYAYVAQYHNGKIARFNMETFDEVAVLDLAAADADLTSFQTGFSDGRYGYVLPVLSGHRKVARFDLKTFSSVEVLDLSFNADLHEFWAGFSDGRHGYLVPHGTGSNKHGKVVRFTLHDFTYAGMLDVAAESGDSQVVGFTAGFIDGVYAYLIPNSYGSGQGDRHGKVARFDLATFSTVDVLDLSTADLGAGATAALKGFWGGFTDGVYGYCVPFHDGTAYYGKMVRFKLQGFGQQSAGDVQVLDLLPGAPAPSLSFGHGFTDGKYGYVMYWKSKVMRFPLDTFATVEELDTTGIGLTYLWDGFAQDSYGFATEKDTGKIARFGVEPTWSTAVSILDVSTADAYAKGFNTGFSDGTWGYLVPNKRSSSAHHGLAIRFRLSDFNEIQKLDLTQGGTATDLVGFTFGFQNAGYGYMLPGTSSKAVRFSLAGFDSIQTLDLVHDNIGGRGFTDGTYAYMTGGSAIITRFHIQDFSTVQHLDPSSVDSDLTNWKGGGLAYGGYGYLVPGANGKVARFSLQDFDTTSIAVLDLTQTDATLLDFTGSFSNNGYGYLMPNSHSKLVRFHLPSFGGVQFLDLSTTDPTLSQFRQGFTDEKYGYLVPMGGGTRKGKVVRFNLETFGDVAVLDLTRTESTLKGFGSGFTDDFHAYLVPYYNGNDYASKVVRFSIVKNATTTTTTITTACDSHFCELRGTHQFDGTNLVDLTDQCQSTIGGPLTVAATVTRDTGETSTPRMIWAISKADDTGPLLELKFGNSGQLTLAHRHTNSGASTVQVLGSFVNQGETKRVMATIDGSGLMELWEDGASMGTAQSSPMPVIARRIRIAENARDDDAAGNWLIGSVTDFFVFDYVASWDVALGCATTVTATTTETTTTTTKTLLATTSSTSTGSGTSTVTGTWMTVRLVKVEDQALAFAEVEGRARGSGALVVPFAYHYEHGDHPSNPVTNCFDGRTNNYCHSKALSTGQTENALVVTYPADIEELLLVNRQDCCERHADGVVVEVLCNDTFVKQETLVGIHSSYTVQIPTDVCSPSTNSRTASTTGSSTSTVTGTSTTTLTTVDFVTTSTTSTSTWIATTSSIQVTTFSTSLGNEQSASTHMGTFPTSTDMETFQSSVQSTAALSSILSTSTGDERPASTHMGTFNDVTTSSIWPTAALPTSLSTSTGDEQPTSTHMGSFNGVATSSIWPTAALPTSLSSPHGDEQPASTHIGTFSGVATSSIWPTVLPLERAGRSSVSATLTSWRDQDIASTTNGPNKDEDPTSTGSSNQFQVSTTAEVRDANPDGSGNPMGTSSAAPYTVGVTTEGSQSTSNGASNDRGQKTEVSNSPAARDASLDVVEEETKEALVQLARADWMVVTSELNGRAVSFFNVDRLAQNVNSSAAGSVPERVQIPTPASVDMDISVPTSLLFKFAQEDEEVSFAVSKLNPSMHLGFSTRPPEGQNGPTADVMAMVSMDFRRTASGDKLPVSELEQPVRFTLPVNFTKNMACAVWEEQQWSTRGVHTANNEENGTYIACETYHLSVFGAIIQGFIRTWLCANFDIINMEALRQMLGGSWVTSLGAIICWCLLGALAIMFGAAAVVDRRRMKLIGWLDEYFLTEEAQPIAITDPASVAVDAPTESRASQEEGQAKAKDMILGVLCSCMECLKSSSAVREALDDIISNWFHQFAEVRSFLEGMCEGFESGISGTASWLSALCNDFTTTCVLVASRRVAASTMGMSEDLVLFVMQDSDLIRYLMEPHNERAVARARGLETPDGPQNTSRKGEWKATRGDQRAAWTLLHDEVSHHMVTQTQTLTDRGMIKSMLIIFTNNNPIGAAFNIDIFITCKQRVVLIAIDIFGALALSCLFFEAAGLVRGKPISGVTACDGGDDDEIGLRIGRFLVIALGSVLVAGLPGVILQSLQTKGFKKLDRRGSAAWKKQLRVWVIQERLFWFVSLITLMMQIVYTLLFVSNIGTQDDQDWSLAGIIAVFQDFLILPFMAAALLPTLTLAVLFLHSYITKKDIGTIIRHASEALHRRTNVMLPIVSA